MEQHKSNAGFTFVELAMVMIIAGVILGVFTSSFYLYNMRRAQEVTFESIKQSREGIFTYLERFSVYPCPADPTLSPGDANYGVADCAAAGIARPQGRDVDGNGVGETVLIGAVPFVDIDLILRREANLSESDTLDGWGNKLTYAITQELTEPANYADTSGAITIMDEFSQHVIEPESTAHLVIVSHGSNGFGAYSRQGGARAGCTVSTIPTPPVPGVVSPDLGEDENCDDDARFLSGLRNEGDDYYNDDYIRFLISRTNDLWEIVDADGTMITNTNPGFVGIGAVEPTQQLEVAGDIGAPTALALDVCNGNSTNAADCMPVETLTTVGVDCPNPNEVIRYFDENGVVCKNVFDYASYVECPAGTAARGVTASTGYICEPI